MTRIHILHHISYYDFRSRATSNSSGIFSISWCMTWSSNSLSMGSDSLQFMELFRSTVLLSTASCCLLIIHLDIDRGISMKFMIRRYITTSPVSTPGQILSTYFRMNSERCSSSLNEIKPKYSTGTHSVNILFTHWLSFLVYWKGFLHLLVSRYRDVRMIRISRMNCGIISTGIFEKKKKVERREERIREQMTWIQNSGGQKRAWAQNWQRIESPPLYFSLHLFRICMKQPTSKSRMKGLAMLLKLMKITLNPISFQSQLESLSSSIPYMQSMKGRMVMFRNRKNVSLFTWQTLVSVWVQQCSAEIEQFMNSTMMQLLICITPPKAIPTKTDEEKLLIPKAAHAPKITSMNEKMKEMNLLNLLLQYGFQRFFQMMSLGGGAFKNQMWDPLILVIEQGLQHLKRSLWHILF